MPPVTSTCYLPVAAPFLLCTTRNICFIQGDAVGLINNPMHGGDVYLPPRRGLKLMRAHWYMIDHCWPHPPSVLKAYENCKGIQRCLPLTTYFLHYSPLLTTLLTIPTSYYLLLTTIYFLITRGPGLAQG